MSPITTLYVKAIVASTPTSDQPPAQPVAVGEGAISWFFGSLVSPILGAFNEGVDSISTELTMACLAIAAVGLLYHGSRERRDWTDFIKPVGIPLLAAAVLANRAELAAWAEAQGTQIG